MGRDAGPEPRPRGREGAAPVLRNGNNVGIQVGEVSGWICAVDLDCEEAVRLAPRFLTDTLKSGKQGIASHWVYRSEGAARQSYAIREGGAHVEAGMLVEVVASADGKGFQFVVPPSVHPQKGLYEWLPRGVGFDPERIAETDPADLTCEVRELATAVAVARFFPPEGARYEFSLALCGFLLRRLDPETVDRILLATTVVKPYSSEEKREEAREGIPHGVASTARGLEKGEPVTGGPRSRSTRRVW